MRTILSMLCAAFVAFGGFAVAGGAAQAAVTAPQSAGIVADNVVQKTHGYHRYWRHGHRHGRRYRPVRRWYGHRRYSRWGYHCHRRGYRRVCHSHRFFRRHHRH